MENLIIDQFLCQGADLEECSDFSFFYHPIQSYLENSGLVGH